MTAKQEGDNTPKKKVPIRVATKPTQTSLNKAVQLLLDQMPDYVDQLVTEIALQSFIPKWQLIGGILFEAYNNGYLSAYTLDPAWNDGFKIEESVCGYCHDKYMPVRIGQLFCCNECGQGRPKIGEEAHAKKEALKKEEEKTKSGDANSILSDLIKSNAKRNPTPEVKEASGSGWIDGVLD